MIVKIPVYFEIEEKLKPSEVNDLIQVLQNSLTVDLHALSSRGNFKVNFLNRKFSIQLLTWQQVKNRVTKTV